MASGHGRHIAVTPEPERTFFSVGEWPLHISHGDSSPIPGVFCTHFYNYNHAHHLRLEKLLCLELSRSSNGFFNYFWIQVAVLLLKLPYGGLRSELAVT